MIQKKRCIIFVICYSALKATLITVFSENTKF
jgi:hypothetical protein